MKTIAHYLTFLALLTPACFAEDAWLLEMDSRYADALLSKSRSGVLEEYRSALSKLPELIKSSKIREIERISSSDGEKGGIHFPQKKFPGRLGDKEVMFHVGSSYSTMKTWRSFKIRQREAMPQLNFEVALFGVLGKEWAPTLVVNSGKACRVILERNLESLLDLPKWPAVMTLSADLPTPTTISWPITTEHQEFLQATTETTAELVKKNRYPGFYYRDVTEHYDKRIMNIRVAGLTLSTKRTKSGLLEFRMEHVVFYPSGKRVADVQTGSLNFPMKGNPEAVDVNVYKEDYDKETGFHSRIDEKISGKLQCRITP